MKCHGSSAILVTACLLSSILTACGETAISEEDIARSNVWHEAKLRGVAFRAIGQEPGWLLEIKNGQEILIVTNYGQNRVTYPYVEPQEDKAARQTLFQVDADTSVLIEGNPCSDTMSGEQFQSSVTLNIGERMLKGCGRALF